MNEREVKEMAVRQYERSLSSAIVAGDARLQELRELRREIDARAKARGQRTPAKKAVGDVRAAAFAIRDKHFPHITDAALEDQLRKDGYL